MSNNTRFKKKSIAYFLPTILMVGIVFASTLSAQQVSIHITKGDQTALLEEQTPISFNDGIITNATIDVNEQNTFQSIDGFGFMMTQGSAQVLNDLNPTLQNQVLQETFNPNNGGSQFSVMRISIGASDLSNSVYFYNDTPGDVAMNDFSLEGPDTEHLIPIIKKVLEINPSIKILATPWSAPPWMKTNSNSPFNPAIGGSLAPQFYEAYATYFVRYLQAMEDEGIPIWGITPQNEPENPFNEPSMSMTSDEQLDFINNHLGPQIEAAGFSPKIISFDHNCDNPGYPINVLNNSPYAEGAAFHLYDPGANIEAMSEVRNATGKNVYFTEQFTSDNGEFDGDFGWHTENVVIGSLRNWSKTVIEWNYAADPDSNPRTPGGCDECLGAFTVVNENTVTRNVSYYIISQLSKFVQPGAVRIQTNDEEDDTVTNVALRNTDGEKVLLVYNINSADEVISINWNGRSFTYNLPGRTSATFTWDGDFNPQPPAEPQNVVATGDDEQVLLTWDVASGASNYAVRRATNPNGPFTTIVSNLTNTTYTDTNVTNGTTYYYIIRAINDLGTAESAQVSATPNIIIIDAFSQIEAEDFNEGQDVELEDTQDTGGGQNVGFVDNNDFLLFENVDFGNGARSVDVRIASGANFVGTMEIRLGSINGDLIGTVSFGNTGGYQTWVTRESNIAETAGLFDVYLVFQGGDGIGNVNWFRFNEDSLGNDLPEAPANVVATGDDEQVLLTWDVASGASNYAVRRATNPNGPFTTIVSNLTNTTYTDTNVTNGTTYYYIIRAINDLGTAESAQVSALPNIVIIDAFSQIEAEDFNEGQDVELENTQDTGGGQNVGFVDNNDFLLFENVDFGNGARSVDVRIASGANFVGTMEIRLGSITGNPIGTIVFGNTGGYQSWVTRESNIAETAGLFDVYLVFQGGDGIGNVNWFRFNENSLGGDTITPPTVMFTTPLEDVTVEEGYTSLPLVAEAADADGTIVNVGLYIEGILVREDVEAPYTWGSGANTAETLGLTVGTYTFSVVATDNEGATAEDSFTLTVTEVDENQDPTVLFTTPQENLTVEEGYTSLPVVAEAADVDGTVVNVGLYIDGTLIREDLQAPYTWGSGAEAGETLGLQAGSYTFNVLATDNEGATAEDSFTLTVTAVAENQDPTVLFTTPQENLTVEEGYTSLPVVAEAADVDGTIVNVGLFIDNVLIRNEVFAPYEWGNGNNVGETLGLQAGSYTFSVLATDNEGATAEDSFTLTVTAVAENQNPTVLFTTPEENLIVEEGYTSLPIVAEAADMDGTIVNVGLYIDGTLIREDLQAPYTWGSDVDAGETLGLEAGSYTFSVLATDNEGATSEDSFTLTVTELDENQDPTVLFTTPQENLTVNEGYTSLPVVAEAVDMDGTIVNVGLYIDGTLIREDVEAPYTWGSGANTAETLGLTMGIYTFSVVATDSEGGMAEDTFTLTVTEVAENQAPTVMFTTPLEDVMVEEGYTSLPLVAEAADADGTIVNVGLYIEGILVREDVEAPYTWGSGANTTETLGLTVGTYTFSVVATDNEGATTEDSITITIDAALSINEFEELDIHLYPNPASTHFFITGITKKQADLKIVDMLGRIVLKTEIVNENTSIDISKLSAATYVVVIELDDKVTSRRFIKLSSYN